MDTNKTGPVKPPSIDKVAAVLAAAAEDKRVEVSTNEAPKSNAAPPASTNNVLELLTNLLLKDAQRAEDERGVQAAAQEAARKRDLQIRRQNLGAQRERERELKLLQGACTHRTPPPYSGTEVAGWRLVSGRLSLVCQQCGRMFESPEDLAFLNARGLMPASINIAAAPVAS